MKPNYAKGFKFGRRMGLWFQIYKPRHFLSFDGLNQVDGMSLRKDLGKRGKYKQSDRFGLNC